MTTPDLDEVIFRFHRAAVVVTPELVSEWTRDYPQFADDIRAHAVDIIDMQCRVAASTEVPADAPAVREAAAPAPTLREAIKGAGSALRDFADGLGIARSIVADINTGAIEARTIPPVFLRLGAERLRKSQDWFTTVVSNSREPGMAAAFKADGTPVTGRQRTWKEAIEASDMDADRKAFWLSGDV